MDLIRESSLFQSLTQQSREEGFEQGVEQGIEQGIERGKRKSTLEDILEVLEIRFNLPASHPYLLASRLLKIYNTSSSCTVRRYRCPILMNLSAC